MTVIDLRRAKLDDAEAIGRIHVDTWRVTYAGMLPDDMLLKMCEDRQARIWRRLLREGETTVVAEVQQSGIIGFGSFGPNRSGRDGFTGEVYTLYVSPDFQNCGIGRGMLQAMFGALVREGHDSALIWVLAENPSRFFYEAMGGRRIGEREVRMWGTTLRELAYGWESIHALPPAKV